MTSASPFSEPEAASLGEANGERRSAASPEVSASELAGLPHKQPPLARTCLLHGQQPGVGEVSVIASHEALEQISTHSKSDVGRELGGALLGDAFLHDKRVFVEVKAALPVRTGDHGPAHFTFTADSWAQLHQERAASYPDLNVVGWFHTHPNLGVFYSADDVVVHTAAFTLPWHVGLVVDPVRNQASFFGWSDGALSASSGFYEALGGGNRSSVDWKYAPSAVWADRAGSDYSAVPGSRVYAPASGWPSLPAYIAPVGLIAGAAGLVVGFFLLVAWIVVLNQRIDKLEGVALVLADEALSGTNAAACPNANLRIVTPLTGIEASPGERITFIGTADYPNAFRYRLEVRAEGSDAWRLAGTRRQGTALGRLAVWDTIDYPPASYEVRLTAVDRNDVLVSGPADCVIDVELVP